MKWLRALLAASEPDHTLLRLSQEHNAVQAIYGPRTGMVTPLPQYPPATYPDGSTDQLCRDLDVLADAATPGGTTPEAA